MSLDALFVQFLNGLSGASTLFLLAVGLSLIFGVTRVVNFAHGSFYMLGIYVAYTFATRIGATGFGFFAALLGAALLIAVIGALLEMTVLRRVYRAPELFQLLATFAIALIIRDVTLAIWGPEDLLGPRAPGLRGAVTIANHQFPEYDLMLIFIGPVVLLALHLLLTRTRFGILIRAATQDRQMVGALGVNQAWLFTGVFALGAFLAALGGALQAAREAANLSIDLISIGEAFVVVVVGGMGSIPGAFLAALLIAEIKALCIALGNVTLFGIEFSFSKLTLVVEFLVMAAVLIWRPWGLLGKPTSAPRHAGEIERPLAPASPALRRAGWVLLGALLLVPLIGIKSPYTTVLMIDILTAVLFATSLYFIMGPGGMHSFGHAAYFGLGAYGAGMLVKLAGVPMEAGLILSPLIAGAGALIFGWFCTRLSGVYLAMLTLAFAQIVWSVAFQWDSVTGGSNGLVGIWPSAWLTEKWVYYLLTLACVTTGVLFIWRMLLAPFGYALRAARDSPLRADAIGINTFAVQWRGFVIAGMLCGLAGALFAFSKGSIAPDVIHVSRSIDGLVMVLLGGVQSMLGPVVGAAMFTWLQDSIAREFAYWRAALGVVILILVLVFPKGVAGTLEAWLHSRKAAV